MVKEKGYNVYGVELFTTWRVRLARSTVNNRPIKDAG